jgi:hypothetical protein
MTKLAELASLIRSKNAGPFQLTFDIMFDDKNVYEQVKSSGRISAKTIADIYGVPEKDVLFFFVDNALAVKASIPRPVFQGDLGDPDGHGGQQYAPLMEIDI